MIYIIHYDCIVHVSILVGQKAIWSCCRNISCVTTICSIAQHVGVHTQFSGTKTCIKSINKDAKPSEEKELSFVQ